MRRFRFLACACGAMMFSGCTSLHSAAPASSTDRVPAISNVFLRMEETAGKTPADPPQTIVKVSLWGPEPEDLLIGTYPGHGFVLPPADRNGALIAVRIQAGTRVTDVGVFRANSERLVLSERHIDNGKKGDWIAVKTVFAEPGVKVEVAP